MVIRERFVDDVFDGLLALLQNLFHLFEVQRDRNQFPMAGEIIEKEETVLESVVVEVRLKLSRILRGPGVEFEVFEIIDPLKNARAHRFDFERNIGSFIRNKPVDDSAQNQSPLAV